MAAWLPMIFASFPARILKELHNETAPILVDIFNTSLAEGVVPADWKNASVTPVYKKGPKN